MRKHLFLRKRLTNQSQIVCETSLDRWDENVFVASESHDQNGRHAHVWSNPFKNLLRNRHADFQETWYVASGTPAYHNLSLVVRKPVFGVSDQVRHKPGCTASEDDKKLEISDLESRGIVLSE